MRKKTARSLAAYFIIGMLAGMAFYQASQTGMLKPQKGSSDSFTAFFSGGDTLPAVLSARDHELYRKIFLANKHADWQEADNAIAKLDNPVLVGYVLAERYLDRRYDTSAAELKDWLNIYADLPQATSLYELAMAKQPSLKTELPSIRKTSSLQGYGDSNGLVSSFSGSPHAASWNRALAEWKSGDKANAAKQFSAIANHDDLSPWTKSAAAYWAYRAYQSIGESKEAATYLQIAAREPRCFYGILARKQLKQPLDLDKQPVELSRQAVQELLDEPSVRRIIALGEIDQNELAERELRAYYPKASAEQKWQLLALAREMNLASVQITISRLLGQKDRPLDFARYPIPHWQPKDGFKIEPALLYALMRQESGFRASAVSPDGATGLMQLMPQTALMMKKQLGNDSDTLHSLVFTGSAAEPALNIALGQNYVRHLLENTLVEGNLLYMLTAYNAGPARLMQWKETIAHKNDPLLFIESIPYPETRQYVMQVMTNYWIYSELIGNTDKSTVALLRGNWPTMETKIASATFKTG